MAMMLSAGLLAGLVSCESENNTVPELPPVESMVMNFSDFESAPAGSKGTAETYNNFIYSYVTIGFWNITATLVTVLPVAAYAVALDQTPVKTGDLTWEWSYSFKYGAFNYDVILEAERINNESFSAVMMVALSSMPDSPVKWFDGVVRYDHTMASWTIYKEGSVPVLNIEWNKNFETGIADLTYTYVEAGKDETGSYIMWAMDPAVALDASYAVSLAAGQSKIEWNSTTIEGRVKAPLHFGDELWHCWESQANGLMDKDCE